MELDSIEDATSSIVSTIKAFKEYTNEVEAASHATDVFNAIGNTEAVSSKDLGEILKRSASAMAVAGNSLNETAALGAAGNTIVQDSAMMGTALKTLSLRLTSTKVKLEEMGEETEYAAETTSDYRDKLLALTATTSKPVDILGSDGQYKNTYNILKDLSEVWEEMNSMEQSATLKMLFGVRQTNVGAAILTNFDVAERALKTAEESAGSAMEEHNRWADSLEARINQVNSSIQTLSTDIFNTDDLKSFVTGFNDLVQAIDKVVKIFDVGKIAIGAFSTWLLNTKNIIGATVTETGSQISFFGKQWNIFNNSATTANHALELQASSAASVTRSLQMYNSSLGQTSRLNTTLAETIPTTTMQQYLVSLNGAEASLQGYCTWLAKSAAATENANIVINRYQSLTALGADAQAIFRSELAKTNPAMAQYLATTNSANMSQENYQRQLRKTELQSKATALATQALNMAMNMLVMGVITGVIQLVGYLAERYDKLIEKSSELRTEMKTRVSTLTNLRKQYEELLTSTTDEETKNATLTEIKKQLVEQYGFEEEKIRTINGLRKEGLGFIDEEIAKQRQKTIGETEDAYNKAMSQIDVVQTKLSTADFDIPLNMDNIRGDIQNLFDKVETENGGIALELNADNAIEYKRKLEDVRTALINVRGETGAFTKDEQKLFDAIDYMFTDIWVDPNSNIPVIGGIYNWVANLLPTDKDFKEAEDALRLRAEDLYATYVSQVGKTFEDVKDADDYSSWLQGLYQKAKDVYGDEYFTYYKTMFNDMFEEIKASYTGLADTVKSGNSDIDALILKSKQGLSDLDTKINTAADSLEDLRKIISNNKDSDKFFSAKDIIEILDKYPDLADAIEKTQYGYKLNVEALDELKQKQIEEKQATLQQELDKSRIVLREAQRRLEIKKAEYEAISEFDRAYIGPVTGQKLNNVKTGTEYNVTLKKYKEAEKTVNKLQMQIDLLNVDFDDISDSTADIKANLDNQKDTLNDIKDDLEDSKKYIEDLVDLTVEMIKKNKQLEKEGLQKQLEDYKKMVDKKKELIDLEKEEVNFSKDLKQQNEELLKLQSQLDALSVSGVDYSLEDIKRRNELEEEVAKKKSERDDFLYEHEVEVRKDALDKAEESFEEQINVQIKSIEDYLDKEGIIRQDAMNLINSKTEEFYNDLRNYTITYTEKSEYEFNKLWNNAYDAMAKYGNGQIDVLTTLAYLDAQIVATENQIKSLETVANAASNSTKNGINATREAVQALNHDLEETGNLMANMASGGGVTTTTSTSHSYWPTSTKQAYEKILNGEMTAKEYIQQLNGLPKFHDGGVVNGNGEVLAKLMSGEVVSTQKQAETFLNKTLPNLIDTGTRIVNNKSASNTSFTLGDLIVNGNADSNTVNNLRRLKDEIADAIFSKINSSLQVSVGGRIR